MAEDIKDIGKGYFKENGALRTGDFGRSLGADQVPTQESKPQKISNQEDAIQTNLGNPTQEALASVKGRTLEQVNTAANAVNQKIDLVKEAQQIVKQEKKVLKELKENKDLSSEETDKLTAEFGRLEEQRASLAKTIEQENRASVEGGPYRVSVGNKNFGSFDTAPIEFEKEQKVDLGSKEDIKRAIESLSQENQRLVEQKDDLKGVRIDINLASKEVREEIEGISKASDDAYSSISSDLEASKIAQQVRDAILSAGAPKALAAFKPTAATEQILRDLSR